MNRDEMLNYILIISESTGSKLKNLMEKEGEFMERGNKHDERFTKRQFDLAVDPIIKAEHIRCQILELIRKRSMSVKEMASGLQLSTKDTLQHLNVLLSRNLITVDSIMNRVPLYRGLPEEPEREEKPQKKTENV